jgi:peroxiredoxin
MRTWIVIAAVLVGVLVVWAHNNTYPGKPAPDFSLRTVDGQTVKLSDRRGKVVLLDFWATWCGPCRASLPHIQELRESQSWADSGLVVWAVNDRESAQKVGDFLANNQFTFTALIDGDGIVASDYGVRGIPMTVLIGRDGTVKNVWVGYGGDSAREIDDAVRKALAEPRN